MNSAWGILPRYQDAFGNTVEISDATRRQLIEAMGGDPEAPGPPTDPDRIRFVRQGRPSPLDGRVEIRLEHGDVRTAESELPADLPLGYHELRHLDHDDRPPTTLVVAPATAYRPEGMRTFGPAAQVYALRSSESWGIGDFGDLRRFGTWARGHGAGLCLINPLAPVAPVEPREPSPYFPTSRRFLDWIYLRIEEVPGAAAVADAITPCATAARELNSRREIDRDEAARLKLDALEAIWDATDPRPTIDDASEELRTFALWCALAEDHGRDWRSWPAELQRPDTTAVREEAHHRGDRVRFHVWLQELCRRQLDLAAEALPLLSDLPVGFDPGGADAWVWQDLLADGVTIGAPPDELGPQGQNWGLPVFVPWRLRADAYRPFIQTLRAAFRGAAALRIDHVLGLFRQFWIPEDRPPSEGAYVAQPTEELLDLVCLESHRAQCVVVGEDLGTVGEGVRDTLGARDILRYQVLWFEQDDPVDWSERSLGSVSTHDLPTIAGVRTGSDLAELEHLGLDPDPSSQNGMRAALERAGVDPMSSAPEATVAVHRQLAGAASAIVVGQVEDLLGVRERPNVPGTDHGTRPANWSLAYPALLEEIETNPTVVSGLRAMGEGR